MIQVGARKMTVGEVARVKAGGVEAFMSDAPRRGAMLVAPGAINAVDGTGG